MSETQGRFTLEDLAMMVAARAAASPEESYTAKLVAAGVPRIAKKFGEEAVETVLAAVLEDDQALINECADLFFHLFVLLHARAIPFEVILDELAARRRQSGLAEKAARKNPAP